MSPPLPVAVSCGDPAGIGPEIAARAWDALRDDVPFFWIGDPAHVPSIVPVMPLADPSEAAAAAAHGLPVLAQEFPAPATHGAPDPRNAEAIIDAIALGAEFAANGAASALCTAPINKKALIDGAGFAFPGHTEYLAHLTGVERVVMMLASDTLRVVPATIHLPLAEVPATLTRGLLEDTLRITHAGLIRDFGIAAPRIAVAGLNPHAGEGGAMGREEMETIAPTIEALRAEGLDISGPASADTMFHEAAREGYDAAVCMYHDQALIPIKTLAFDEGVNVTLGLPFLRTSPDHGTAYDIAGQDRANPASMIAALRMAAALGARRGAG